MNRTSLFTLALLVMLAAGSGWFLLSDIPSIEALNRETTAEVDADVSTTSVPSVKQMPYQKAVIASVLAAVYAAERGAKITQIEAMIAGMQESAATLSPEQRVELDKILALLPDNKRERDASYALYFQGIGALAAADTATADAALGTVEAELNKAGLARLVRYIPPIRAQLIRARQQPIKPADQPSLILELESALKT